VHAEGGHTKDVNRRADICWTRIVLTTVRAIRVQHAIVLSVHAEGGHPKGVNRRADTSQQPCSGAALTFQQRIPGDNARVERPGIEQGMNIKTGRRGLLAAGLALVAAPTRSFATPTDAAWRALGEAGQVLRPGMDGFADSVLPQNLRYAAMLPQALLRCASPEGLSLALRWARDHRMPFVLRSGGHSYAGTSTTPGLLIDLRRLNAASFGSDGLLRAGGGLINGEAYDALRERGLTVTHGRCLGVGLSAFLMGGGVGFAMRDRGLGCDAVVAVDIMLADGSIRRASATENPELFWAIRGGGGGTLGAAVGWTLRPTVAEPTAWFRMVWTQRPEEILWRLVQALEAAPSRIGSKISLIAGRSPKVALIGQIRGTAREAADILDPVGPAAERSIVDADYWTAQAALSEVGPPALYQETSRFTGRLPHGLVEAAMRRCVDFPGTGGEADFKLFHVGGRIRDVPRDATAYVHRDAEWLAGTELTWAADDPTARIERALEWQEDFRQVIAATAGGPGGSFQNFLDPGLANPAEAYYGANLPRLAALKRQLDPDNLFAPPRRQGILA